MISKKNIILKKINKFAESYKKIEKKNVRIYK